MHSLPNPVAIICWRDDYLQVDHHNEAFASHFSALIEPGDIELPWQAKLRAEFATFILSEKKQQRFEIERMASLGVEAFACSLS